MNDTYLNSLLGSVNIGLIIKPATLVAIGLYLVFALVIIRQVGLMTSFLGSNTTPLIRLVAWIHFFLAAAIFIFVLVFI